MNDDELRRRYQAGMRNADATAHAAPDPELMNRVVRGEASDAERLSVLDLVMQSEELRREYDTFRALAASERTVPARWPRLLAAAVVLIAAGGILTWRSATPPEEVWRGASGQDFLVAPAPTAVVALPVTLVWHVVPGAHAYAIEILNDEGTVLTQFTTTDTMVVIPETVEFTPGSHYGWAVTARLDTGASTRSTLSRFSIQP
ncbi:MAG: hypothetical protein E4H17_00160 [Gemmatimonadales bacterium]|nr:MAG: hypothetical protein E4H17_00160 [Gemmatimonadales bacterium]